MTSGGFITGVAAVVEGNATAFVRLSEALVMLSVASHQSSFRLSSPKTRGPKLLLGGKRCDTPGWFGGPETLQPTGVLSRRGTTEAVHAWS